MAEKKKKEIKKPHKVLNYNNILLKITINNKYFIFQMK